MDKADIYFIIGIILSILAFFRIDWKVVRAKLWPPKDGEVPMPSPTSFKRQLLLVGLIFASLVLSSMGWYGSHRPKIVEKIVEKPIPIKNIFYVPKTTPQEHRTYATVDFLKRECPGQDARDSQFIHKYRDNIWQCFPIERLNHSWIVILVFDYPLQFTDVDLERPDGTRIGSSRGSPRGQWLKEYPDPYRPDRVVAPIFIPKSITDKEKVIVIRPIQVGTANLQIGSTN